MEQPDFLQKIELIKDYPAKIAESLIEDKIDIGLVPVAILPQLKDPHLISRYCIGAEGPVASVSIFSQVPMEQIEKVYLDYQSRTSIQLAKILFKEYWNKEVEWMKAEEGYIHKIVGNTAGVIIGDRALNAIPHFQYNFDLAETWIKYTGYPFVFATWVANKPIPLAFCEAFDRANAYGFEHLEEVIATIPSTTLRAYNMHQYYTQNISYAFTPEKRKGMELFLEKLSASS